MKKLLIIFIFAATNLSAQTVTQQNILQGVTPANPDAIPLNEIIFDRVIYSDDVYSDSRKTELGDQTRVDLAVRYHKDPTTFARMRFATDPSLDRNDNKTSRFEFIFSRMFSNFTFQLDMELLTDDTEDGTDSSGMSLGLDLDSDDTFLSFNHQQFSYTFYLFNFRSDVGDEFNTLDVSRIHSISGSPTAISATPVSDERIISKTIPGLEVQYFTGNHSAYVGMGVATYLYPTNGNFDIEDNASADSWERKETTAFKAGYLFMDQENTKVNLQYVTHQNTQETGALLKSASSLNIFKRISSTVVEFETTVSRAGKAPYDIDRQNNWFNNQTPFRPIFSDRSGNEQDWIDKTGQAYSLKLGYNFEKITPYLDLKYQDEYFIFQGDESAHRLRNNEEDQSHGGLTRLGLGAYFYYDNIFFRPKIEWQKAENAVFTNATDLRSDRELSSFQKENIVLTMNVTFTFDGSNSNQMWWF